MRTSSWSNHHIMRQQTENVTLSNTTNIFMASNRWEKSGMIHFVVCLLISTLIRLKPCNLTVFCAHAGSDIVILTIHVDDSTMTGSSVTLQQEFKMWINAKFQLTNLRLISWLLGLAITHDHAMHTHSLSQHAYIDTLLSCFNLKDCKLLAQPLNLHAQLFKNWCSGTIEEKMAMKAVPY